MLVPLLYSLLASVVSPPSGVRVGSMSLEDMVRYADTIVVGQVERVSELARSEPSTWHPKPGESITDDWKHERERVSVIPSAEIAIERVIAGPSDAKQAHFLARGTWMCDTTSATVGVRELLFLREARIEEALPGFVGSIRAATKGAPFYRVLHSGRGAMRIFDAPAPDHVNCSDDIVLPRTLLDALGVEKQDSFSIPVPLAMFEREVAAITARQLPYFELRAPARGPDAEAWTLSLWGDGVSSIKFEREERGTFYPPKNRECVVPLTEAFERERFIELPSTIGGPIDPAASITLEQRTAKGRHTIVLGAHDSPTMQTPGPELARALRLYVHLRDLVTVPGASDDRTRIRELLARAR